MDDKLKFNIEETRNLDECMNWVESYFCSGPIGEDLFLEWSQQDESDALVGIHHGMGTFIRNTLELWENGPAVKWFNDNGIYHADDMSSIIFKSLHRRVNGNDIKLDDQIKKYRDHWEKYDPKVNEGKYGK